MRTHRVLYSLAGVMIAALCVVVITMPTVGSGPISLLGGITLILIIYAIFSKWLDDDDSNSEYASRKRAQVIGLLEIQATLMGVDGPMDMESFLEQQVPGLKIRMKVTGEEVILTLSESGRYIGTLHLQEELSQLFLVAPLGPQPTPEMSH